MQHLAQIYGIINRFLVLLGACPNCYSFSRNTEQLSKEICIGGRNFSLIERIPQNVAIVRTHETCEKCGYDFGVFDRAYTL